VAIRALVEISATQSMLDMPVPTRASPFNGFVGGMRRHELFDLSSSG